MKALSIRQPWAWAILNADKRLENRDWAGCAYRGAVLLHASKSVGTRDEFDDAVETILAIANPAAGAERIAFLRTLAAMQIGGRGYHHAEGHWVPAPELRRGGIVGRARIHSVIRGGSDLSADQRAWWAGGFALVLADVEPLPFVPCKGALGFFDVPDYALARAAEAP